MASKIRITVLISGNGSNLQSLIDDKSQALTSTSIIRVISNRKSAHGLTRASNASIPTAYHNLIAYRKRFPGDDQKAREEYDRDLAELILKDDPDLVVCAGFMHVLSTRFLEPLEEREVRIINLHPGRYFPTAFQLVILLVSTALRGQYNGANAIERAHADFMVNKIKETGVMIHYVSLDMLSIILRLLPCLIIHARSFQRLIWASQFFKCLFPSHIQKTMTSPLWRLEYTISNTKLS